MANLNLFELETCLKNLDTFATRHPRKAYATRLHARVKTALATFREQETSTDKLYFAWRRELAEDLNAVKSLNRVYKEAQSQLAALGVIFDSDHEHLARRIGYFDKDELLGYVDDMIDFLNQNRHSLDFAAESIAEMERFKALSTNEHSETDQARELYRRKAVGRKMAIENATNIIVDFRDAIRNDVGPDSPLYTSILWPAALNPDAV